MPVVRTFDDVDPMFKLNPDGESCTTINVLGEEAYKKALAEGWTPIDKLPKLPFPTGVYRALANDPRYGEMKRIENRTELNEALKPCSKNCAAGCRTHGWRREVMAAPPAEPVPSVPLPAAAPAAPGTDKATIELALELVKANTRAQEQDVKIEQLTELVNQLLEKKGKKGTEAA